MRVRACRYLVALEGSPGGVEIGDVVPFLADEPDTPLGVEVRIAGPRFLPWNLPLRNLKRGARRTLGRQRTRGEEDRDGRENTLERWECLRLVLVRGVCQY